MLRSPDAANAAAPPPPGARTTRFRERLSNPSFLVVPVLIWLAIAAVLRGLYYYTDFPLDPVDGAFQTYDAMRSILSGEVLGRDYQSYLGLLMPSALLPGFVLLGETVFAGVFTSSVAVIVVFFLMTLAFRRLIWRASWATDLLWAAAVTAMTIASLRFTWRVILPGISLRPLRWMLPFLIVWLYLPLFRALVARLDGGRSPLAPIAAVGGIAGLALLWSNDAGIPNLLATFGVLALLCIRRQRLAAFLLSMLVYLVAAACTASAVVLWLTGGAPGPWLRYTFVDAPAYQYWYFGTWGPNDRITSLHNILVLLFTSFGWFVVAVAVAALVGAWRLFRGRTDPVRTALLTYAFAAVTGTILLPQLTGHSTFSYSIGATLSGLFVPFMLIHPTPPEPGRRRWIAPVLALVALLGSTASMLASGLRLYVKRPAATGNVYSPSVGAYVDAPTADMLAMFAEAAPLFAQIRPNPRQRILADYYNSVEIAAKALQPSPYPTIIHVLGDKSRADYLDTLRTARFPIVTALRQSTYAETNWNMRASWYFFREMLARYEPFAYSPQDTLFRPRTTPLPAPVPGLCDIRPAADGTAMLEIRESPDHPVPFPSPWLVEVDADMALAKQPLLWVVRDVRSSARRRDWYAKRWFTYPDFGLPPSNRLTFSNDLVAGKSTRLRLMPLVRGAPAIVTGRCRVSILMQNPLAQDLPRLTRPMLRQVLLSQR